MRRCPTCGRGRAPLPEPDWPGYALCATLGSVLTLFVVFLVFAERLM